MKTVIIKGPQGCGKSTLAERMASIAGSYIRVNMDKVVNSSFGLGSALDSEPNTLIFEETLDNSRHIELAQHLVSDGSIKINVKYKWPCEVNVPNIIFVLGPRSCIFESAFPDIHVIDIPLLNAKDD